MIKKRCIMIPDVVKAFFAIFVVMDTLGNLPIFCALIGKSTERKIKELTNETILVASLILFAFLFFGTIIFSLFGISLESFMIAGGIVLLLLGLKFVLGIRLQEKHSQSYNEAIVPMATPLITGPGVITTVVILSNTYGIFVTLAASLLNLLFTFIVLRNTGTIYKFLGRQGSDVLTRIMGLILAAIAVEFIRNGIVGFL
jgi:multiple antibiotic resistance protein